MQLAAGTARLRDVAGPHHGDLSGDAGWAHDTAVGPMLHLAGAGWVDVGLIPLVYPMSINLWFRTTTSDAGIPIAWGNTGAALPVIQPYIAGGTAWLSVRDDSGNIDEDSGGSSDLSDGQPHLMGVVLASASLRLLYVDGVLVATFVKSLGSITLNNTQIGRRLSLAPVSPFIGDLGLITVAYRAVGAVEQWQRWAWQSRWNMLNPRQASRRLMARQAEPESPLLFRRSLTPRAGARGAISC
jgi:hypothetical protein